MDAPEIQSVSEISPVTPAWINEAEKKRYPASMEFWYPRLKEVAEITTPKTEWVSLEPSVIEEGTIHEHHWASFDEEELRNAVIAVGGPPAFLRTDQASDIYNMEQSSKIRSLSTKEIKSSAGGVIGFNATKAELPFCSFAIREWLDIESYFTAWSGKKIGVELRFFISDGTVESWCFDWPKNQIQPDTDDWEQKYEKTKEVAESYANDVLPLAQKVAKRFANVSTGKWSVDFVLTTSGEWYCTDMAPKQMSQVANEVKHVSEMQ